MSALAGSPSLAEAGAGLLEADVGVGLAVEGVDDLERGAEARREAPPRGLGGLLGDGG